VVAQPAIQLAATEASSANNSDVAASSHASAPVDGMSLLSLLTYL